MAAVSSVVVNEVQLSLRVEIRFSKQDERINCSPEAGAMVMMERLMLCFPTDNVVVEPN